MRRTDEVWKRQELVRTFLDGVRAAIPFAAEQLEVMLRIIAAAGRPVNRLADLGCGAGALARAILAEHPGAEAVLVDFSEPMLRAARERLGGNPRVHFIAADLAEPSWRDQLDERAFDVVVSGYAIHHLPDTRKRELYGEILSLLAPGGTFINVEHVASATPWLEAVSDDWMIDHMHAREQSGRSREQVAHEFVHRPDKAANILAPVERQCDWLRGLGFADVDCYFKSFELAVFGGRRPSA